MILYASPMSPFSARVRFSLYYKSIEFQQVKPSSMGGMKSDAFLNITPIGKIPVLELDSGVRIPESDVIVEYLDDVYPGRPLRPQDPGLRAQARIVSRIADLYVLGRLLHNGLASMMPISLHAQPRPVDPGIVEREYDTLKKALNNLEYYMAEKGPFALGEHPSTADGALAPYLTFIEYAGQVVGRPEFLTSQRKLGGYLERASAAEPAFERTRAEVVQALIDRRGEVAANAGQARQPA